MTREPNISRAEFAEVLTQIAAMYGREFTSLQAEIYFAALGNLTRSALIQAASRHARDAERGRFMPLPSDFVAAIQGTRQQRALRAFTRLRAGMRDAGAHNSVVIAGDPAAALAIDNTGGWVKACGAYQADPAEFERRFASVYANACEDPELLAMAPAVLEGRNAQIARQMNKPVPRPVVLDMNRGSMRMLAEGEDPRRLLAGVP